MQLSFFLLFTAFGLYGIGALSSLFLIKKGQIAHKLQAFFSIAASAAGLLSAILRLLSGSCDSDILFLNSQILHIKFDSLTALFILALSVLNLCVSIYSIGYIQRQAPDNKKGLFGFINNLFVFSMLAVLTSGNMILFLVMWEIMSLTSYFLVVFESDKFKNRQAGLLYLVMTHIATAFLTIAFALIYKYSGSLEIGSAAIQAPDAVRNTIFICLLLGFGTKAGIMPLHIWLPHAHPAAPSNVSALMSGIMIKTAVYGLFRFILGPLGAGFEWWGMTILVLGAISTVLGVAFALMEHDIKKLLAYHSIENIGIILMGAGITFMATAAGNTALAALSLLASLFHTINHTIFKGALFLGAGSIHYATGTKDIEKLGGLLKKMPATGLFFLTACLAISAIPPLNGFVSEWLTYQSFFLNIQQSGSIEKLISILAVAGLAMAGALAAMCFVKCFGISFLGLPRSDAAKNAREVPKTMIAGIGILSSLCIVLGLFPALMTGLIDNVNQEIFGFTAMQNVSGSSFMLFYPLKAGANSISLLTAAILTILIIVFVFVMIRLIGGKKKQRSYGTWDCGYKELNPRMQYTATGFSKPIRIVFRGLFFPSRELETEEGPTPYTPHSIRYIVKTKHVVENYIYWPFYNFFKRFSKRMAHSVQTGSLHAYLIYVFGAVLLLLVYYCIFGQGK